MMLELCVRVCQSFCLISSMMPILQCDSSKANTTSGGDCGDGELQLANETDEYNEWTRRGRVELCINNAWGTVCGTSFSVPDALVVCNQLVGFQREG